MKRFFPGEGDPGLPMRLAGVIYPAFDSELDTLGSEHGLEVIAAAAVKNCYYETAGERAIAYGAIHTDNLDYDFVSFSDICVVPDLQGRGIGSRFVRDLEGMARKLGAKEARLMVQGPGLTRFYGKLGYTPLRSSLAMGKAL